MSGVEDLQEVADRFLDGRTSAPVALMELLLKTADFEVVARVVPTLRGDPVRLDELVRLCESHARGCATIAEMLRGGLDSPAPASSVEEGIARSRTLFDDSVGRSEEASVALYSLGSPEVLAAATDEAVSVLEMWGVLNEGRDALEIGCGIGRFLVSLAPRLRSVVGVDVSPKMVAAARRRVAGLPRARVMLTDGHDLAAFAAGSVDLVLCIDAFPYIVQAGGDLAETYIREAFRVLRARGDFVLFNYAYGRPRSTDAREAREIGTRAGFDVVRLDETPFRLWNGIAYHLRRP